MKIAIDGTEIFGERAIKRYTYSLITELARLDRENEYVVFYIAFHKEFRKLVPNLHKPNFNNVICKLPARILLPIWNHTNFPPIEYFTGDVDIFHSTNFTVPAQRKGKKVFTLHGVVYLEAPEFFPESFLRISRNSLRVATKRSQYFIAVSNNTKEVFLAHTKLPAERVFAIPLGVGQEFRVLKNQEELRARVKQAYGIARPYLLFVGAIERRKNVEGVLESYHILRKRGAEHELVIAGAKGYSYELLRQKIAEYKLWDHVKYLGNISQDTDALPLLYNGAQVFLFPSFVEGWASPPLEAMKCGCPVVTSNVSSLPETVGDAALKVNPYDPEEIADAVERVLTDSDLRRTLIEKGLERASQFTWEKMAKAHLEVYKKVASM